MDALCIVAAAMADRGYIADAVTLSTTCNDLFTYEPLWGIIKNVQSPMNRTSLMYAARCGKVERFKWLLARGADPHGVDTKGFSALHYASYHGHEEVVRILIGLGVKLNEFTISPRGTPLNFAALHRHTEIVRMLCAAGAYCTTWLTSPAFDAIEYQFPSFSIQGMQSEEQADRVSGEIIDILYKAGMRLRADEDVAAYIKVIGRGQVHTLRALMANGCNPMCFQYVVKHEPFLHLAIRCRRIEMLRELCKIGMWINGVNSMGRAPLDEIDIHRKCYGELCYSTDLGVKLDAMEKILLEHGAKKMAYRSLNL